MVLGELLNFDNVVRGMERVAAERQLFMTDLTLFPITIPLAMSDIFAIERQPAKQNQQAIFRSYMSEIPVATPDEGLLFPAFRRSLEEAPIGRDGAITVNGLFPVLTRICNESFPAKGSVRGPRSQTHLDFDFHYPVRRGGVSPDDSVHGVTSGPVASASVGSVKSGATVRSAGEALEDADTLEASATLGPAPLPLEASTDFVPDDAEVERDDLDRSVLAIGLARRLHRIWRRTNSAPGAASGSSSSFVVHIDAPWGGGKTSFANFIGRVLNPVPRGRSPAAFLSDRYPGKNLRSIFLDDPPATSADTARLLALSEDARRPWILVDFNAWQNEHCKPPWWVFYQEIRRQCFAAIGSEGTHPVCTNKRPDGREPLLRWGHWLRLHVSEYLWRLFNPKVLTLLLTALVSGLLFWGLLKTGAVGLVGEANKQTVGFAIGNMLGFLLGGVTGLSIIWAIATIFTESIVPGTDTLAERLNLGKGDPFDRFRRHFDRTMRALKRPVMVVIDDLDRCQPAFVVDLVRGIQTILKSSRVTFVILGDRDWIEHAFETHHKEMTGVDVGPEQSFGARFVEKAIQMSFLLPALELRAQKAYVRRILFAGREKDGASGVLSSTLAARIRVLANIYVTEPGAPLELDPLVDRAVSDILREQPDLGGQADLRSAVEELVGEAVAINAAVDENVEAAIAHELEPLAAAFPSNPRQIKRIVNAITIYWAVAVQRRELRPDADFRFQLAIWIIVMTEWPRSWRALSRDPDLADLLGNTAPLKAFDRAFPEKTAETDARRAELARMLADKQLLALVTGKGATPHTPLSSASILRLRDLTPLRPRRTPAAVPLPAAPGS